MVMGVSVIIPVKGRANYLENLLKSIAEAKRYTLDQIEIIVVDSSDKKTCSEIEAICNKFGASYHHLQKGVSDARNYGIRIAKCPIILFVDSDCEVDRNIFNEHLKCYQTEEIGGCAGVTEFVGKRTWLWNVIEKMPFLQPFQWAKWKSHVTWAPCTNISFRKDVLERVNGFQSILPPKESGEDVDLGYRITSLGYKICCNSNAKVYHTHETWSKLSQFIERTFRFGRGEYHLMKKHPENTFLDIPKNSFMFIALAVCFVCYAFIKSNLLYVIIPFVWLPIVILVQSVLALKQSLINGDRHDIGYVYVSSLFEILFELGTIVECLRKRDLKFLFRRFIYAEDQLFGRWYWGIIKMWSFIITLFIIFLFLIIR
ncbi:MAG TPA: glycosyltransferase [Thermotogaceae bacterium]|nr:glycosyltransferase [Thermotogaceae bacterium]